MNKRSLIVSGQTIFMFTILGLVLAVGSESALDSIQIVGRTVSVGIIVGFVIVFVEWLL